MSKIYVLIGPKGGGKSYLGRLLEKELGIAFLAIEEIFLQLQAKGISTPDVQAKGYQIVEEQVLEILAGGSDVSFELTVLTPASTDLLNRLKSRAPVEIVAVVAPPELCLARIKTRDAARHIDIAEEKIAEINRISLSQQLDAALRVDTSTMNDDVILQIFKQMFDI